MSEATMWAGLRDRLPLHMERVTEKLHGGFPDVLYVDPKTSYTGLVELKFLPTLGREGRPRIPWKSAEQPAWLSRWARNGGNAGVLLLASREGRYVFWRARGTPLWVREVQTSRAWDFVDGSVDVLDGNFVAKLVRLLTS